jgi:hypothetical protein
VYGKFGIVTRWGDTFYLAYGLYDSGKHNIILADSPAKPARILRNVMQLNTSNVKSRPFEKLQI